MKGGKFRVFKLLILIFIVAVVSAVPSLVFAKNVRSKIDESLNGKLSDFQGVINIWNVDTFESGSQSKIVYLENATNKFSHEFKGVYFLIKNISVQELINNLMNEVYPDIISFGFGIGNVVKPILKSLEDLNLSGVRNEILTSGQVDGLTQSVGYLMGGYILASTDEKLSLAKVDTTKNLVSSLNVSGFDTETKKGVKHTYSLVAGENEYIKPLASLERLSNTSVSDVYKPKTMYDAYMDFTNYSKGTILLGTHRDLFKLSGKIKVGKLEGVKIEYLTGFTNLIQYAGILNNINERKLSTAKKFIEFLICEQMQSYSTKIGMVNVIGKNYYEDGEFKLLESALNEKLDLDNVFV